MNFNLKEARMIKFDGKAWHLVPLICTCELCLLGLFQKCEYDLFDDLVLTKHVVAINKETKLTMKQEEVEEDHLSMDFPNESYNYKNISAVSADLSFEIGLDSTNTSSDTIILSDIENTSIINRVSSSSDDVLTGNHYLKVSIDPVKADEILARWDQSRVESQHFQVKKEYYTDFVNDMFRIIDEASVSKTDVRFVVLYQFVLVINNFNDKKTISNCIKPLQKQINPVPTKLLIPIFSSRRMFQAKTLVWPEYFRQGVSGHFITVALYIDDNKIKIYDSLINSEYIYYDGVKQIMMNVLKELRSIKKLSADHPDCEVIHPEGQINSDCGPLTILFAELFFEKQEQFIPNLKYEDEVFKLRAHHKWCLTEKKYTSRISIKQQLVPMLSSTPRPSRKRRFGQTLNRKNIFK